MEIPDNHRELSLDGEPFIMTPDNATLYTFRPPNEFYSHIFLEHGRGEEDTILGSYIFAANAPAYDGLKRFMQDKQYPQVLNMIEPARCDVQAFEDLYYKDIRNISSLPEGWDS